MSAAAWGFAGVFVTQCVILTGLLVNRRDTKQINRAVNHQPSGSATLVERMASTEVRLARMEQSQGWQLQALKAIARNTGTKLPACPGG